MDQQRDTVDENGGGNGGDVAPSHQNDQVHDVAVANEAQSEASGFENHAPLEPRRDLPLASSSSGTMAGVAPRYAIDADARSPAPVLDESVSEAPMAATPQLYTAAVEPNTAAVEPFAVANDTAAEIETSPPEARTSASLDAVRAAPAFSLFQDARSPAVSVYGTFMTAMTDSSLTFHQSFVNALRTQLQESVEFLQQLVSARDPAEAFAIQARYWERQMAIMNAQADEVRRAGERAFESATRPFSDELRRATERYRIC